MGNALNKFTCNFYHVLGTSDRIVQDTTGSTPSDRIPRAEMPCAENPSAENYRAENHGRQNHHR